MTRLFILVQMYVENKGSLMGFAEDLARLASAQGYTVIILCGRSNASGASVEYKDYAEIHRVGRGIFGYGPLFRILPIAFRIRRYFKRSPPAPGDIIVANGDIALGALGYRYVLRAADQPALTMLHNMEIGKTEVSISTRIARFFDYMMFYPIDLITVKNAKSIIYSSSQNRLENIRYYSVEHTPYFIPFKGTATVNMHHVRSYSIRGRTLLFIARSDERVRKGVGYLERILPALFEEYPDLKLLHIGKAFDWNVPSWCKERIVNVDNVQQNEMMKYYLAADIYVSCSLSEGFPSTLMEAMAAGVPIVTSDIEGVSDYIRHMKEGYVFPRGDSEALKKGITLLLDDDETRRKLGLTACIRIKKVDCRVFNTALLSFLEDSAAGVAKSRNLLIN